MEVFEARQREHDRRWDYTCTNSGGTHPLGYCTGRGPTAEGYHADGHATEAEARACYAKYELDKALRFHEDAATQHRCQVCDVWTTGRAHVGFGVAKIYDVCPVHQTRADVERLHTQGAVSP